MATLLLERGAKATLADDDRTTPLHEAAWDGQHVLVRLLLDHGAKVNAADRHGRTPLHRAVSAFRPERSEKRDYVRTIEMLVQAGSSTTAVDCNGRTPLEGVQSEYRERIRQLLLP
jgi:ankyrin repeat protein